MAPPQPERSGLARLVAAWRALAREQRLVVAAAAVLLATMLLPWYSRSVTAVVDGRLDRLTETKLALTVFSFVEAAIFLVAVGIIALMLARGARRAFHLPGGDGAIVAISGAWAVFLVFFRFIDKPSGSGATQNRVPVSIDYDLSWGIFFGLLAALALVAAGLRLRAAQVAEPALPGDVAPNGGPASTAEQRPRTPRAAAPSPAPRSDDPTRARRRQREESRRAARATAETPIRARRSPPDEAPTRHAAPDEAPTRHATPDEAPTRHAVPDDAGPTRPFGTPPSFEAPELPPPSRRAPKE